MTKPHKVWEISLRLKTDMIDDEDKAVTLINDMINTLRTEGVLYPSEAVYIADVKEAEESDLEDLIDDRGDPHG